MFRAETPEEKAAREAGQEEIPQPVAVVVPVVVVVRTPLKKTGGRPRKKPFEPLVETEPVNFDADEPEAKKVKRVNVKWSSDDVKVVFRVLKECGGNRARTIRSLNDNPESGRGDHACVPRTLREWGTVQPLKESLCNHRHVTSVHENNRKNRNWN